MKIARRSLIVGMMVLIPFGSGAQTEYPVHVSIIQLIATPERFDGKIVAVTGFLTIGRESDFLYLSQTDYEHALPENALTFDLTEGMGKDREQLNGRYVRLVGVFRASRPGGYPCPNGKITNVSRYHVWSFSNGPVDDTLDH